MNGKQLLALYGLKWNPFSPELPPEALVNTPKTEDFFWRVENLVMDGGFALISGESGLGKSVVLRMLFERLSALREVTLAEFTRPQSTQADFYRELGMLFGVELKVSNRWGGYQALRDKWQQHIESTLLRPVLFIDEAQEMDVRVLSELRLLSSRRFDSQIILTTVLCGDTRLLDKLRNRELIPLGNRMRTRLLLERWSIEDLEALLEECLKRAGAPKLMTAQLVRTLAEHAAGNPRIMMNLAGELLMLGAKQERKQLDEKLYLEAFAAEPPPRVVKRRRTA
jgi:general secretion pathway protein A